MCFLGMPHGYLMVARDGTGLELNLQKSYSRNYYRNDSKCILDMIWKMLWNSHWNMLNCSVVCSLCWQGTNNCLCWDLSLVSFFQGDDQLAVSHLKAPSVFWSQFWLFLASLGTVTRIMSCLCHVLAGCFLLLGVQAGVHKKPSEKHSMSCHVLPSNHTANIHPRVHPSTHPLKEEISKQSHNGP